MKDKAKQFWDKYDTVIIDGLCTLCIAGVAYEIGKLEMRCACAESLLAAVCSTNSTTE
jgi:hypothetical protein